MHFVALAMLKAVSCREFDFPGMVIQSLKRMAAAVPVVEVADQVKSIGGRGGLAADKRAGIAESPGRNPMKSVVKVTIRPVRKPWCAAVLGTGEGV
jgi:hypothetical protein